MKKKELKARITELEAELAALKQGGYEWQGHLADMIAEERLISALDRVARTGTCEGWKTEFGIPCWGERTRVKVNGRFIP